MRRLRELLRFDGRLSRLGYWRAYLLLTIAMAFTWCLGLFAILAIGPVGGVLLLPIVSIPVALVAISVRRLHDRNKSGWWALPLVVFPLMVSFALSAETAGADPPAMDVLLALTSFVLSIWAWIEIGFRRGAAGPNRYGEPHPVAS
ncbi:MAG: hypothetical protein JWP50_2510 [Phenylobacterium sp.]|nr:hypothetical protein [Phenylobacterium sp.]